MTHRTCKIDGCGRKHYARGYCNKHWQRWRTHGDPNFVTKHVPKVCKEDNCETTQIARGWCQHHYDAWRIHGDPLHHEKNQRPDTCTAKSCERPVEAVEWCDMHYRRFRKYGDANHVPDKTGPKVTLSTCEVEGCSTKAIAHGMCDNHYRLWRKYGTPNNTVPSICRTCGQPYMANRLNTANCSRVCVVEDRQHNKFGYRQRKGRMKNAFVESVSRPILYERDRWVCGICGEPVDKNERHPSPWSPSLDHVIPLSKGGEHSYKNCQLAHLRCNIQKGDRMD